MNYATTRAKTRRVHPATHRIVKFFPMIAPSRGDVILVDGERCKVTKSMVRWDDSTWTVDDLWVEHA